MQSPPFGILGINNNNPATQVTLSKTRTTTRTTRAYPATNPTNRVGQRGGEGGTGEQGEPKQSAGGAKKSRAFTGDSPHPPHRPDESEQTLPSRVNDTDDDNDIFVDSSRTPQDKIESKGEEGAPATAPVAKKRRASNPIVQVAVGPSLLILRHNYPKDLPQGTTSSSRSGYHEPAKRRRTGKSSRHMTGGCEWWALVWCSHIHVLEGPSRQRSDARTGHDKQLHWVVQNP